MFITRLFLPLKRFTNKVIEACDLYFKPKLPLKKVAHAIIYILASFAQKIGSFKKYLYTTLKNNTKAIDPIKTIEAIFSIASTALLSVLIYFTPLKRKIIYYLNSSINSLIRGSFSSYSLSNSSV